MYVTNRFAKAHRFSYSISELSGSDPLKLMALLLCFPRFEASNLCFRLGYFLNQRRALCIRQKGALLVIEDGSLEFDNLSLKGRDIPNAYHRFRNVYCGIQ